MRPKEVFTLWKESCAWLY